MDFNEAMKQILDHVDALENVEESINYLKSAINDRAERNDNQDWETKYNDLEKRYNTLNSQYRERFFANDMNTVNREDAAAQQRETDYAGEEREKQISTDIKLEDLLDN